MKPFLRKTLRFFAVSFFAFFILYWFLLSDFNPMFDDENYQFLKTEIEKTKKEDLAGLPEIYLKIYEINSVKNTLFFHKTGYLDSCPSLDVTRSYGHLFRSNIKLPFVEAIYAIKIEKEFSDIDCLRFLFLDSDYLFRNRGVKVASEFYFKKNLSELNQEEKLTLIVMLSNPSLYNPIRRPKKVKNKVLIFKDILNKQLQTN